MKRGKGEKEEEGIVFYWALAVLDEWSIVDRLPGCVVRGHNSRLTTDNYAFFTSLYSILGLPLTPPSEGWKEMKRSLYTLPAASLMA